MTIGIIIEKLFFCLVILSLFDRGSKAITGLMRCKTRERRMRYILKFWKDHLADSYLLTVIKISLSMLVVATTYHILTVLNSKLIENILLGFFD